MDESLKQLEEQCKAIAKEIAEGMIVTEETVDYYDGLKVGDKLSAYEYLQDSFDVEFVCGQDSQGLTYKSGTVSVAIGGPHIKLVTNAYNDGVNIVGTWGTGKVIEAVKDNLGIDNYLEELFNMNKEL